MVLAAIYSAGVFTLLGLILVVSDIQLSSSDWWSLAGPLAILFGFAFIVLAFARRAGFSLLWTILVALWIWMLFGNGLTPLSDLLAQGIGHPFRFAMWSVLALPLFGIGVSAAGDVLIMKLGRRRISALASLGCLWLVFIGIAFALRSYADPHHGYGASWAPLATETSWVPLAIVGWLLWAPLPFVIAAMSMRAVWIATKNAPVVEAAA